MVSSFLRIGIHLQESVLERLRHVGEIDLLHGLPELRRDAVLAGHGRGVHQLAHLARMA